MTGSRNPASQGVRLDKWLWAARFFKTRALAAEAVRSGRVELNSARAKPARAVAAGDGLTIRKGPFVFHIEVSLVSSQRGPAAQAAEMYSESESSRHARSLVSERLRAEAAARGEHSKGRPTKRDRRQIVRFQRREGD